MKYARPVSILCLVALAGLLIGPTSGQSPAHEAPAERSVHLLDRGGESTRPTAGPPPTMMATLAVGSATPGITMVGVLGGATMLPAPAFYGNFFAAPTDFPSSWYPFDVTGVFAWQTMVPAPPGDFVLGAGVAPGPFAGDMGTMWAAFGTAMVPFPMFMTPSLIGAPGNLPSPLPVPSGSPALGVACGLLTFPAGPFLGAIVPTASPRDARSFNGPPIGPDVLLPPPTFGLFLHWVSGCFVSGATVPVELQSFHVE